MQFRWSKSVPQDEASAWEDSLMEGGETNWVVLAQRGGRFEVQIYAESPDDLEAYQDEHGGKVENLGDQNWVELSAQQTAGTTIKIRDRIIVTLDGDPDFQSRLREEYPDRILLTFPPDLAFGTGDHATTATCLRLLVDLAPPLKEGSWSLLDLGTGTGILAIAAHFLGANPILACDNDPKCIQVSQKSFLRHGIAKEQIDLLEVDLLSPGALKALGNKRYQVVTANLFSTVLIKVMPIIQSSVAPGGWAMLSGILTPQAPDVLAAAEGAGLELDRRIERGRWTSLLLRASSPKS